MKKIDWKAIAPYIVIPLIFVLCISIYATMGDTQRDKKQYYEIVDLFEDNEVSEYTLNLASGSLEYKLFGDDDTTYIPCRMFRCLLTIFTTALLNIISKIPIIRLKWITNRVIRARGL